MPLASIELRNLQDTAYLGQWLAQNLPLYCLPPVLLNGPLGAGKTALTNYLVKNLDGAENAEVTSPSFTIYNIYPTRPVVYHCDLYRCQKNAPEEIFEALEKSDAIIIIEWANYLFPQDMPLEFLDINFFLDNDRRLVKLNANSERTMNLVKALKTDWKKYLSLKG